MTVLGAWTEAAADGTSADGAAAVQLLQRRRPWLMQGVKDPQEVQAKE